MADKKPPLNPALLWVRGLGQGKAREQRLRGAPTRALLYALATRVDADLVAFPSERKLAADAGISYSTVQVLLPQLVKCGALRIAQPQRGTYPARYQFTRCAYDGLPAKLDPRPDRKPKPEPATPQLRTERRTALWAAMGSAPPGGAVAGSSAPPGGEVASAPPGGTSAPPGGTSAPPGGAEVNQEVHQEGPPTGGAFPGGELHERGGMAGKPAAAQAGEDNHAPPRVAPAAPGNGVPIQSPLVAQVPTTPPPAQAPAHSAEAVAADG